MINSYQESIINNKDQRTVSFQKRFSEEDFENQRSIHNENESLLNEEEERPEPPIIPSERSNETRSNETRSKKIFITTLFRLLEHVKQCCLICSGKYMIDEQGSIIFYDPIDRDLEQQESDQDLENTRLIP